MIKQISKIFLVKIKILYLEIINIIVNINNYKKSELKY